MTGQRMSSWLKLSNVLNLPLPSLVTNQFSMGAQRYLGPVNIYSATGPIISETFRQIIPQSLLSDIIKISGLLCATCQNILVPTSVLN